MAESTTMDKEQKIRFNTGLLKNKDGGTFYPKIKSIDQQIKDNSELIRMLRQEISKHPEEEIALSIALESAISHRTRLYNIFKV